MENIKFKEEINESFTNILDFWVNNTLDANYGGFVGRIDFDGNIDTEADKGGVLNSRILWSFSTAYNFTKNPTYLSIAERAFSYITQNFWDNQFGGIYWAVSSIGVPTNKRKQIYGQAFAIYGFSEFYKATGNQKALELSKELFYLIEKHGFDIENNGYLEAFAANWGELSDYRLSEKDLNAPKTMNTHLHILEAYANLYSIWKEKVLANKIKNLLKLFSENIINKNNNHLGLFFDNRWILESGCVSYGHDIEAAWLLLEAAETLENNDLITLFKKVAVKMADAALEGLLDGKSLIHEFDLSSKHYLTHKEWWVQAEAMVGFLNAYQISGNHIFYDTVLKLWEFIKNHLINKTQGEWIWGVSEDNLPMTNEDLVGFWKCPYHNSRACIELLKRLNQI